MTCWAISIHLRGDASRVRGSTDLRIWRAPGAYDLRLNSFLLCFFKHLFTVTLRWTYFSIATLHPIQAIILARHIAPISVQPFACGRSSYLRQLYLRTSRKLCIKIHARQRTGRNPFLGPGAIPTQDMGVEPEVLDVKPRVWQSNLTVLGSLWSCLFSKIYPGLRGTELCSPAVGYVGMVPENFFQCSEAHKIMWLWRDTLSWGVKTRKLWSDHLLPIVRFYRDEM